MSGKEEGVQRLLNGAKRACEIVGFAFGPNGRNVAFKDPGGFTRTIRDGIKVIEAIRDPDLAAQMGIDIIRDGSKKTHTLAGDGTTSTAVMAGCLLETVTDSALLNAAPIVSRIKAMSTPVTSKQQLINVATISANNRKDIGEIVGEIVWNTGKMGVVGVDRNSVAKTETELLAGYVNDGGAMSPLFLRNSRQIDLQDAMIVIVDQSIEHVDEIKELINQWASYIWPTTGSPLVFVCHNMVGSAMASILKNVDQLPIFVIKAPNKAPTNRFEMLDDLRIVVGSSRVYSNVGGHNLKTAAVSHKELEGIYRSTPQNRSQAEYVAECIRAALNGRFGIADVRIEGDRAMFMPKQKQRSEDKIAMLTDQLNKTEVGTNLYEELSERIARLQGAFGRIKIHAQTEIELSYIYELYDDAVRASFCALKDGIVPGAGDVYAECMQSKGLQDALKLFLGKLDVNGNIVNPDEPVWEPATVPINVIQNSFSIVEQLLMTKYVIC